jgi:hypothetical protein
VLHLNLSKQISKPLGEPTARDKYPLATLSGAQA